MEVYLEYGLTHKINTLRSDTVRVKPTDTLAREKSDSKTQVPEERKEKYLGSQRIITKIKETFIYVKKENHCNHHSAYYRI